MIEITDHADERIKERLGLPKSARMSTAERAYTKGNTHSQARGKLKRYLDYCWLSHKNANNVRVYAQHIWFFKDNVLITVYDVPKHMRY